MGATPEHQVDTLREAYALVYRCPAAEFEVRVFFKCLYWHAGIPARWIWWTEREFFRPDLEALRAMGNARSEPDLQRAIDDLENQGLVERSIRRGRFHIRLSTNRLITLLRPLLPLLKPVAEDPPEDFIIRPTTESNVLGPFTAAIDGPRGAAPRLRSLKRLHSEVVQGRPIEDALADVKLTWEEAESALAEVATGRPDLAWLRTYLSELRELARLRSKNL